MNLVELYEQTPRERHPAIVVSGDRVFPDGEEYVIELGGQLRLVRSSRGLEQRLAQIVAKLGVP